MASRFDANHHDKKTKTYSGQFSPKVLLLPIKMSLKTSESDYGKSKSLCYQISHLTSPTYEMVVSRFEVNHHYKKTKKYSRQFSPKVLLLPVKMSLRTSESDNGKSKSLCYVFLVQKDAEYLVSLGPV